MIKTPLIFDRAKSYYKNNRWQGRIILTVLIFTLILGVVRSELGFSWSVFPLEH